MNNMETKGENTSPILDNIINYFWGKEGVIFSAIYLFFSPIIYGLIRLIPNENLKNWILALWILLSIIAVIFIVGYFLKKQITTDSAEGFDKKHFFAQYGLITAYNLLKDKEDKLINGDKVIIYTSKLNTENGQAEEDGETLSVNAIADKNILNGVEYHILYYREDNIKNKQELETKYKTVMKLPADANSVDYQLSDGNRSGFDMILFYYKSTGKIEAFFCVNFVDDTVNREGKQNCRSCHNNNRCHPKGTESDKNPYLLYKQIQDDLATDIYNTLLKKINPQAENITVNDTTDTKTSSKKIVQIFKLSIIIIASVLVPTLGYISTQIDFLKIVLGHVLISDVFFGLMLYLVLVFSLIVISNMQKLTITNTSLFKKLFENYGLMLEKDMINKRKNFPKEEQIGNNEKEVWIFTDDLPTDILNNKYQKIIKSNIKKGIHYIIYYNDNLYAKDNISKFEKGLDKKNKNTVPFIPLKNSDEQKMVLLPNLLGSISFHNGEATHLEQSYFSLRGGNNKNHIYFNMPRCVSEEFHKYFNDIKTEYINSNINNNG